eukprot:gene19551-30118_t
MNGPDELEIEIDGEETPVTARVHAILSAAKSRRESNPQSSEPSAFPYCNAGGSAWELEGGSQDAAEMTVGQEFRDGLRPSSKRGSAANLPTMAFPLESRHTLIQSGPSKPAVAAWPSASAAGRKGPDTFHSEAPASRARLAATPIAPAPSFEAADSASQGSRFSEGDNMQGRDPESKRFSGLMQTGDVFTSGGRPVDSMKQELEEAREKIRSAEVRELVLLREIEKLRVKGGEARGARSDHGDRTQAPEGSLPLLSPTRTGRARNEALLANTSQQQQQQQLCDAKSPPSFLSNAYPAARRVSFDRSAPAAFEKQLDPLVTLVVPSAPKTLVLASGRPEYPEFSGRYHLHPSKSNGAPLWKQANGEAWLYSSPLGVWTVTDDQQHFSTGAGFIAAVDVHDNQPPNANSEWNVLQQDSSWKADDALTIKAVPAAYLRNANSSAALVALTIHPKTRATFSYPSVTASSGMRLQVIVPPGATVSIADGYLSDADILTHSVDVHPGMANSRAPLAEDVARHQDRQFFEERRDLLSYGNNSNINNNNINNINSNNNSNNNNNNDDATRRTSADAPKAKSSGNASGSDNFAAIVSGTYPPTNSAADTPALSPNKKRKKWAEGKGTQKAVMTDADATGRRGAGDQAEASRVRRGRNGSRNRQEDEPAVPAGGRPRRRLQMGGRGKGTQKAVMTDVMTDATGSRGRGGRGAVDQAEASRVRRGRNDSRNRQDDEPAASAPAGGRGGRGG